jgi:hypothetical protein
MSFDQRLRDALEREAARLDPDVERQLGAVEARVRRGSPIDSATLVIAAAVLVAALILRTQGFGPPGGGGSSGSPNEPASPSASAEQSPATFPQVSGTYTVTLDPSDPAVKRDGLGGAWTMRLLPDGEVFLTAPSTYLPGANGLSGFAFSVSGDRFRTNLFINGACTTVGSYAWSRAGGGLALTPVDDACSIRRTLLATNPWTVAP